MTLEVRQYHDCQKPDMRTGEVEEWTERTGLFWTKETHSRELYDDREARWTCRHCESRWRYRPGYNGYEGSWFAEDRKSYWTEIDE